MARINWKVLIASFIVIAIVALVGSLFTEIGTWYESVKPSITPPNYVFPIAWNILFILIALSLYFAWTNAGKKQKTRIAIVYGINFVLNILWTILYFQMKNPFASFIEIIVLWFSILAMMIASWKISKTASLLLLPYLLWVGFASILNYLTIMNV